MMIDRRAGEPDVSSAGDVARICWLRITVVAG